MKKLFRALINVAHPFRVLYWFIFRPHTRGVKCLIEHNGNFLLVRPSYGHKQWTLVSGGVKRNESLEHACRREVREEVGIELGDIRGIGEFKDASEYKKDTVFIFYAPADSRDVKIDEIEIIEYGWFPSDELPAGHRPSVDKALDMLSDSVPH